MESTITGVPTSITAFVGIATTEPVHVTSYADYQRAFGDSTALQLFFLNGGTDAVIAGDLQALDNVDLFNLLCVPEDADLDAAAAYCTLRRAMLLVDPPASWTSIDDVQLTTHSANAALYFPQLVTDDGNVAPSAAIAGVFARTDASRGVWTAPAGVEAQLLGVRGFTVSLDNNDSATLNALGVNGLRVIKPYGPLVWGARTTEVGGDWTYVPVRRLALYIEQSVTRGLEWAVFEPNDATLWNSIQLTVSAFMASLFAQGAFAGTTQQDAFYVMCDASTTIQADIDAGIVNVVVAFAPLAPAEFIVITIQQLAGQSAGQ